MTAADQAYQDALAQLSADEQREWAKCLGDVSISMARAARQQPGQTVTFIPQYGGAFYRAKGQQNAVGHCDHLPSVMRHCAASGWEITVIPAPWFRRWAGQAPTYRVRVAGAAGYSVVLNKPLSP